MARGALGWNPAPDTVHIEKYALDLIPEEQRPTHVPVPLGINWYPAFDNPIKGADGRYRLPTKRLGDVEGGHDICAGPHDFDDPEPWWAFYNQGDEPACVGFAHARAMSLLTRRTFDPLWLYDDARREEGTYPAGEGSTNRSACAALKQWGAHFEDGVVAHRTPWRRGAPGQSIASYRWATSVEQILATLGIASGGEVPLLQSWGEDYPHVVYAAPELLARLMREGGEASVIVLGG